MKLTDEQLHKVSYNTGYGQALKDYAWWHNGVQYVGCGVKTLEKALSEMGGKDAVTKPNKNGS